MKTRGSLLLLFICGWLVVGCTPFHSNPVGQSPRGQEPFAALRVAQPGIRQDLPLLRQGNGSIDMAREPLNEPDYHQSRFNGKKVVLPSELALHSNGLPSTYVVAPDDVLQVFLWQNPDLSDRKSVV